MTQRVVNLLTLTAQGATAETTTPDVDSLPGDSLFDGVAERKARITVDVSAVGGTPQFDVALVALIDGVNVVLHTFTQFTAAGQQTVVLDVVPRNVRVRYTIAGTTPSITATVSSLRI